MAKVNAPLLSFSATGSIADTQTYATWKGRPYVRQKVTPSNPKTAEQSKTRNAFKFLNALFKYMPAQALAAWQLYGDNSRFTARNGFLKLNNGPLRTATDLENIILSPSAGSGLVAANMTVAPAAGKVTATLTAPTLPDGWTVVEAIAVAVRDGDPQTSVIYDVHVGSKNASPYAVDVTGLTATKKYVVGGWFKYQKPDGSFAYGQAVNATATPT